MYARLAGGLVGAALHLRLFRHPREETENTSKQINHELLFSEAFDVELRTKFFEVLSLQHGGDASLSAYILYLFV